MALLRDEGTGGIFWWMDGDDVDDDDEMSNR
jgi:hypothetical protein